MCISLGTNDSMICTDAAKHRWISAELCRVHVMVEFLASARKDSEVSPTNNPEKKLITRDDGVGKPRHMSSEAGSVSAGSLAGLEVGVKS